MSDVNLTRRQLQAIVAVAELRNISHAAVQLAVTQPSLSRVITRIENDLATPLFIRDTTGVSPTEAGERLATRAAEVLRQIDDMEDELRTLDGELRGRVCVAMPDTIGHTMFLPLLDRFANTHPDVEIRVMGAHPNNVPLALSAGDADVGIISSAHKQEGLVVRPMAAEHLYLVGSGGRARHGDIELADVAKIPLALPGIQPGLRQVIDRAFASKGLKPNVVIEVDSQDTLVELIRDGRAQSIMSYSGVLRPKQRGEVVARRIVNPTLDREIGTAFPNNRSPTHLMRGVEEELHQLAHELAPTARWTIP